MKKYIYSAPLIALTLLIAAPVHAIDLRVESNASVDVQKPVPPPAGGMRPLPSLMPREEMVRPTAPTGETSSDPKARFQAMQTMQATIALRAQAFKENLAKMKSAPVGERKAFVVKAFTEAATSLSAAHDRFVEGLKKAEARGIDTAEARVHFSLAWSLIQEEKADLSAFSALTVTSSNAAEAKALAQKIEARFKQIREEMRKGAEALKAQIQVKVETQATVETTPQTNQ